MLKIKLPLIWKIIIACLLGIAFGKILPLCFVKCFVTFNDFFAQFIAFLVPLIILGLVTPAIYRLGDKAGRLLLGSVLLAYFSTIIAGFFSYGVSINLFPHFIEADTTTAISKSATAIEPYFKIPFPPLLDVMSALVTAFIFGIFLTFTQGKNLQGFFNELEEIVMMSISRILIPLLPLYIFGIFLKMTYTGETGPVLSVFTNVILIIFILCLVFIVAEFCIAGIIAHTNPFKALVHMLTAYITALGTSSSAATIPVTLKQVIKCGVKTEIAGFTVPLCATVHLPGSTIKIVACSIAIMIMQGYDFSFGQIMGFIMLLAVTMVAAPGVPGGAVMAALGVLASSLGFNEENQSLVIALYIVMDSFGTACNVTCDGALSIIINHFAKKDSTPTPQN